MFVYIDKKAIAVILETSDLGSITPYQLRSKLEIKFNLDQGGLNPYRNVISKLMTHCIYNISQRQNKQAAYMGVIPS